MRRCCLSTPATRQPAITPARAPDGPVWTQRAALPTPRAEVASAVLDGRIYVIAGFEASGNGSNVVEVYETASDRWQRRANLPEARDHAMAAAARCTCSAAAGTTGVTANVFAYDPAADAWSRGADMPLRRTVVQARSPLQILERGVVWPGCTVL